MTSSLRESIELLNHLNFENNTPTYGSSGVTSPLSNSTEELLDYSEHERSEMSVLNNLWYKEAIFYEVYVRAFCDTEGTGSGGLSGITNRLDYLHSLGVDCIWLLPIYPSPLKDDGYDVSDYCDIHPDYGTLNDFKILVKAVHERNMKIIADLIPNHCSHKHKWFQSARQSRDSPYRDYFVWSDTPLKYKEARIIFLDVEQSNWTWDEMAGQYYWHRFYKEQPDLNFENPKVQEEMLNILKFWLDLGIDGFRVDAVPYLFEREGTSCENLPETHDYLKKMRKFIDDSYPGRIILAEACQMPNEVRKYFGDADEFHMGFHFPVMPRIYMAIERERGECLREIMEQTPEIPNTCQWVTFLRNHDELTLEMVTNDERKEMWNHYAPIPRMRINLGIRRRLAPLMNNDQRKIELAYSLLFTLPGSPIIYYGDEICMGDNIWLEDRHGVRTPMQWDDTTNGGFSSAQKLYSPIINDEEYGYQRVNVSASERDPSSLFNIIRQMIQRRRKHISFGHGSFKWVPSDNPSVIAYMRICGIDRMLIVHNLSNQTQTTRLQTHEPLNEMYQRAARSGSANINRELKTPKPQRRNVSATTTIPHSPPSSSTTSSFGSTLNPNIHSKTTTFDSMSQTSVTHGFDPHHPHFLSVQTSDDIQSHYLVDILTDKQLMVDFNGYVDVQVDPYQFFWFSMGELSTLGDGPKSRYLRRKSIAPPLVPNIVNPTYHHFNIPEFHPHSISGADKIDE